MEDYDIPYGLFRAMGADMIDPNTARGAQYSSVDSNLETQIHETLKKKLRHHVYCERPFAPRASRFGPLHGMYDEELRRLGCPPSACPASLTAKVSSDPINRHRID